jgi:transcriptional regulator with XRE-family HTH domain
MPMRMGIDMNRRASTGIEDKMSIAPRANLERRSETWPPPTSRVRPAGGSAKRAVGAVQQFGEEVRRRRLALGLTLDELAARAKLSVHYLGEVERGHRPRSPSVGVVLSIAHALGVELGDLFGGYKGLSAGGLEAGRLYDALPSNLKSPALQTLRGLAKCRGEVTAG